MSEFLKGNFKVVSHDVFYFTDQVVNVVFVGIPGSQNWVLIDAGLPGSSKKIVAVAESIYGKNTKRRAIILTNGRFDHVGALTDLLKIWKVNVYAHQLEFPYLCGECSYPVFPEVKENDFNKLSSLHEYEPIDITEILEALPSDFSVPGLPGWEWIHTPGPTPGHVSYFKRNDKIIVVGDVFITAGEDIFHQRSSQHFKISIPPDYLCMNCNATKASIIKLCKLKPNYAITGHGIDAWGERLKTGLNKLIMNFEESMTPNQTPVKKGRKHKKV
jgi:glyoxylase-like metal-dependent hydrolase (beta-lactamase superfamily II)